MPRVKPLIPRRGSKSHLTSSIMTVNKKGVRKKHSNIERFLYCVAGFTESDIITLTLDENIQKKLRSKKSRLLITLSDFEKICSAMKPELYFKFFKFFFTEKESIFVKFLMQETENYSKVVDVLDNEEHKYLGLLNVIVDAKTFEERQEAILEAERIIKGYTFD